MEQVVLGWVTMGGRTVPSEAAKTSLLIPNVFGCGSTGELETLVVSGSLSPVFLKTIHLGEGGVLSAEFAQELWRTEEVVRVLPCRCSVGGGKVAVDNGGDLCGTQPHQAP